ncbi:hypothetical protein HA466_0301760 [Hirschfeldia incana]|nr:hypothetical protein HA466_0301760 [Hirschfeldia incana]
MPVVGDGIFRSNVIHVHSACIEWAPQVYFEHDTVRNLKAELARGLKMKCTKCSLKGAALGCYVKSCRRSYHVPCAREISRCRNPAELCSLDKKPDTTRDLVICGSALSQSDKVDPQDSHTIRFDHRDSSTHQQQNQIIHLRVEQMMSSEKAEEWSSPSEYMSSEVACAVEAFGFNPARTSSDVS